MAPIKEAGWARGRSVNNRSWWAPLWDGAFERKTDRPGPGFVTGVRDVEVCGGADRLIGKEMKDLGEDGWGAGPEGFPVSWWSLAVNLGKGRGQARAENSASNSNFCL